MFLNMLGEINLNLFALIAFMTTVVGLLSMVVVFHISIVKNPKVMNQFFSALNNLFETVFLIFRGSVR